MCTERRGGCIGRPLHRRASLAAAAAAQVAAPALPRPARSAAPSALLRRLCTAQGSPAKAPQRPTPPDLAARMRPPPRQARLMGYIAAAVLLAGAHAASWRQGAGAGAAPLKRRRRRRRRPCPALPPPPCPTHPCPVPPCPCCAAVVAGQAAPSPSSADPCAARNGSFAACVAGGPADADACSFEGGCEMKVPYMTCYEYTVRTVPLQVAGHQAVHLPHLSPAHPPPASFPAPLLPRTLTRATR